MNFSLFTNSDTYDYITINGTKDCNCSKEPCMATDTTDSGDSGTTNYIFYGVIGTVGCLILLVVCMAVIYQCTMLAAWGRRSRDQGEEEE